ncbi:hypothetical protein SAMN05216238_11146 [Lentibacillus persicus]|uniref:Uncharacterized protein n=1 Tax=Lentibacillus persicus TaxID=640948 RepID=A0A1I1Z3E0_9BACI|nr:hypothetical protein [Lentibacillus persicus]SFE24993.1 hypothetical protein SAMN05216238_11146 [Lentibacillus persicus]
MTAEVAILNKSGLALAADSAITSGKDGVRKIYNSANKLFSLSRNHSVGVMVYGAASFMEVPWGVIIKAYRDYLGERTFDYLPHYVDDFLDFLRKDDRFRKPEIEEIIVYRSFSDLLKRIVRETEEELAPDEEPVRSTQLLMKKVQHQLDTFKQQQDWLDLEFPSFRESFMSVIREVREEVILHETADDFDEMLCELAFETVKSDYFSLGSTGLVFTGYGEQEIFPHLVNYRLEGFINGQLKYKELNDKEISYTSDDKAGTAAVLPFGQREMVDSFMYGIEPAIADTIFSIVREVLDDYPQQMKRYLNIDLTDEQVNAQKELGKDIYDSIQTAVSEYQQANYIEPLLGIVRSLPKEELAEMAEALINLTSFKRRLSRVTESVGPPIDVAVITKGDGFIWMKRKHYIDAEINAYD